MTASVVVQPLSPASYRLLSGTAPCPTQAPQTRSSIAWYTERTRLHCEVNRCAKSKPKRPGPGDRRLIPEPLPVEMAAMWTTLRVDHQGLGQPSATLRVAHITTGNDDGNLSLSDELNTGITCF